MTLGDRVVKQRQKHGLTRRALAQKAGLQEFHLAKVERNERPDPSSSTVVKLARALSCTSDYLLGLADDDDDTQEGAA